MPNLRKKGRGIGVWRGKKALKNRTPDPVKKANFAMLETAKIAERARRSAELAKLLSSSAVCSRCGSPIGTKTPATPLAKPLCQRAHAMVTEKHPIPSPPKPPAEPSTVHVAPDTTIVIDADEPAEAAADHATA